MKKPHVRISNLGAFAHPAKADVQASPKAPANARGATPDQRGDMKPKLSHGASKGKRH